MNRKQAREQAFILVFESVFQPDTEMCRIIENFNEIAEQEVADYACLEAVDPFAQRLALGTEANREEADQVIETYAIGWKLNRIPKVALAILRMALYEMECEADIPVSVSINEAVELAKAYSTKEDAAFINGLLGKYHRTKEAAEA